MSLVEIMVLLAANSRFNEQMPPPCPVGTGLLQAGWGHSAVEA